MDAVTSATNSTAAATATASQDGLSRINSGDFMKILIKQLQYQDPFKPMDNEQMVQQMSTIRELEMNTRMSTKLEQLTDQQRFGSAAALIGKYVKGTVTDAEGNQFPREGVVAGVRFTEKGDVMLELDTGEVLPMTALEQVTDVTTTAAGAGTNSTGTTTTGTSTTA